MEYTHKEFCLEVWGDLACFTRPELKVERVSYDVITPSAARAIFEAILYKPAIRWEVTRIEVLNPIKWTSIRRNEVGAIPTSATKVIYIDEKNNKGRLVNRQQRNALMLREVRYRIYAKLIFVPLSQRKVPQRQNDPDDKPIKCFEMFERRASKGQCFNQPYLGTRECSAYFELISNEAQKINLPIAEDRDLGIMLYDMDFSNPKNITAMFYRAVMQQGVIEVPPLNSEEILR